MALRHKFYGTDRELLIRAFPGQGAPSMRHGVRLIGCKAYVVNHT